MPKLKEYQVLRVNIADKARVHPTDENRKWALDPSGRRSWPTWYDHKSGPYNRSEEFIATPINIQELPDDLLHTVQSAYVPLGTEADYSHWYYLERTPKANGTPNAYIVHADDLIPVDFKYPTIMTPNFIKHLQEILALAQLEAARLSQKSEMRIGTADRLLINLRQIGVNVQEDY